MSFHLLKFLEVIHGISEIDGVMNQIESMHKYSWSTWTKAADAALKKYHAKRIIRTVNKLKSECVECVRKIN